MQDDPQRWARVKAVLGLALDANPADRPRVVREACAGSAVLESDVESLLAYANQTGKLDQCLLEPVRDFHPAGEVPSRIGAYNIDRILGSGGMGAVYLGVRDDDELPARAAIKVIHAGTGVALVERFRRERRILSGLIHPYIARFLDAGQLPGGRPYYVMEYVDGSPIDEYAAEHPSEILALFLKVCAAVQFAHQNLVIHRDIKPGNILVTPTEEPRLLDFGIATLLDRQDTTQVTQPRERMLTPYSASPEQAAGDPVAITSDIYSLGVLLYRLLTGVSPYAQATGFVTDPVSVIREYVPPPASSCPNLSRQTRDALRGDIDNILGKTLEKEPSRRYSTARELAADVERHISGLPVEARPSSFSYRAAKFVRRNRLLVAAAALLCLAIAGGLAGTMLYARRAHQEQLRSERELGALRQFMQSVLFEFDASIQSLPGSSAAQALVVRRADQYFEKLASEAGDDPVLLNELADAYMHIAMITGAFESARGATSPRQGLENGLKALAIRRRLVAMNPKNEEFREAMGQVMWETAGRYVNVGDLQRAAELYQEHLQMSDAALRQADTPAHRYDVGTAFTSMGSLERELGHYDRALEYQRRGLAVRESMLKKDPSGVRPHRVVGISHDFIGYALDSQQNYAAAAEEHRKAVALFEPIAKANPGDVSLTRLYGEAQENLCGSLARAGSPEQGLPHCEAAVAIYAAMAAGDPKDVQAFEDLAFGESAFSMALDYAHSPRAALEHQQKARQLFHTTLSLDPDGRNLARFNAASLIELASLLDQLHLPGARRAAANAVQDLERLSAQSPQSHDIAMSLEQARALVRRLR